MPTATIHISKRKILDLILKNDQNYDGLEGLCQQQQGLNTEPSPWGPKVTGMESKVANCLLWPASQHIPAQDTAMAREGLGYSRQRILLAQYVSAIISLYQILLRAKCSKTAKTTPGFWARKFNPRIHCYRKICGVN